MFQHVSYTDLWVVRAAAAVANKGGEPLVIEEVIVSPPKARKVRLKIICTSLCYTDIIVWRMKVWNFYVSFLV